LAREILQRTVTLDASRVIEIGNSPRKLLILCGLGVLMTALAVAVAIPLFPRAHPSTYQQVVAYLGIVLFGLCTVVAAWRLAMTSGPVVTIAPEGIRDIRVAAEFIPWSAVRSIQTWETPGRRSWCFRSTRRSNENSRSPNWRAGRAARTALWAPMASASRRQA
jgi:hypothetical protein